jgi:multidrug efflux system outer membrane protein
MSYELDIWGKYRSGALAAANDLVASAYFRETVRITVAADVARAYFQLRAADALLVVLEDTRKVALRYRASCRQDRFEGGVIGFVRSCARRSRALRGVADIARTRQTSEPGIRASRR